MAETAAARTNPSFGPIIFARSRKEIDTKCAERTAAESKPPATCIYLHVKVGDYHVWFWVGSDPNELMSLSRSPTKTPARRRSRLRSSSLTQPQQHRHGIECTEAASAFCSTPLLLLLISLSTSWARRKEQSGVTAFLILG